MELIYIILIVLLLVFLYTKTPEAYTGGYNAPTESSEITAARAAYTAANKEYKAAAKDYKATKATLSASEKVTAKLHVKRLLSVASKALKYFVSVISD